MTPISLQPITRENWREALALSVRKDQQRFVADYAPVVLVGLAKAYVGALGLSWVPYGIYAAEQMVGFVALAFKPASHDECWLFHFFIDQRFQGQGYGKQALKRLLDHMRENFPDCQAVRLTVHPENISAQRLYTSAGFIPLGEEAFGEPLYQLIIR